MFFTVVFRILLAHLPTPVGQCIAYPIAFNKGQPSIYIIWCCVQFLQCAVPNTYYIKCVYEGQLCQAHSASSEIQGLQRKYFQLLMSTVFSLDQRIHYCLECWFNWIWILLVSKLCVLLNKKQVYSNWFCMFSAWIWFILFCNVISFENSAWNLLHDHWL